MLIVFFSSFRFLFHFHFLGCMQINKKGFFFFRNPARKKDGEFHLHRRKKKKI